MGRVQVCAGRVALIYAQNLIMHIDPWASSKSDKKSLAFYGVGEYDLWWCFRVLYMCSTVFVMVKLEDKDGLNVALDGGYSVSWA